MMDSGKTRRLGRIFRDDGKTVIVPMDHGVSVGPIEGLGDIGKTVNHVTKAGADAVLVHAGPAKTVDTNKAGLIVHLSGATRLTTDPNWKTQVCTVKEAIRLGGDAVSVHINVGSDHERDMLDDLSRILDECDDYSIPLLAMMYPRGGKIQDENAYEVVSHAARLGYELGADIVKTNYTGDVDSFRKVVNSVRVPIVVAGGPKTNGVSECLRLVYESIASGAAGVSIGRNVFQHHDPTMMTRALVEIVHNEANPVRAMAILGEKDETVLART
jgi:fructose-bisphosphate aldolase / 2-amino-3,7-dideoxy-D-threo-hept-6-ulosonate synthase